LSWLLTKDYAMNTYTRTEICLHGFLTSALGGGDWSAVSPTR